MFTVLRSTEFDEWLAALKDHKGKARIVARIRSAELGNLGDTKSVGGGVSEMRVHFGPGYRIYYTRRRQQVIFLLIGGEKSTQAKDIQKAKAMLAELKEPNDEDEN